MLLHIPSFRNAIPILCIYIASVLYHNLGLDARALHSSLQDTFSDLYVQDRVSNIVVDPPLLRRTCHFFPLNF